MATVSCAPLRCSMQHGVSSELVAHTTATRPATQPAAIIPPLHSLPHSREDGTGIDVISFGVMPPRRRPRGGGGVRRQANASESTIRRTDTSHLSDGLASADGPSPAKHHGRGCRHVLVAAQHLLWTAALLTGALLGTMVAAFAALKVARELALLYSSVIHRLPFPFNTMMFWGVLLYLCRALWLEWYGTLHEWKGVRARTVSAFCCLGLGVLLALLSLEPEGLQSRSCELAMIWCIPAVFLHALWKRPPPPRTRYVSCPGDDIGSAAVFRPLHPTQP